MFSFNRVHIIGYQTQPVEVRQTPTGTSVTDLNLVVPYSFQSDSGDTLAGKGFHTVTLWGPMADIAGQYVRPGAQIFISGRLQTDSWENQESGEKRSKTKIIALDMILLDPKDGQLPAPDGVQQINGLPNRVDLVGNVTRDPEMRTTTNGHSVLTLGVATNDRWKDKSSGESRERAEFHNVVIWGDLAQEASATLKKGSRVYVSGRVQTRSWETKDGSKRTTTEVVAENLSLLGTKSNAASESVRTDASPRSASKTVQEGQPEPAAEPVAVPEIDYKSEVKAEDLPF